MAFLVFQLYGDMASWGDIAVGEQRPTHAYPTKSAIVGLVSAVMGITREEEARIQDLHRRLKMAVQIYKRGGFLLDYHTIQVPPQVALKKGKAYTRKEELAALKRHKDAGSTDSGTILSSREYRMEAYSCVALHADEPLLAEIKRCLEKPVFVPYLGRKACPLSLPFVPQVVQLDTFEACFLKYNPTLALPLSREGTETGSSRASEPQVSAALEKILAPLRVSRLCDETESRRPNREGKERPEEGSSARDGGCPAGAARWQVQEGSGGEYGYLWEEGCPTQLAVQKRFTLRGVPVSRSRWQFQDHQLLYAQKGGADVH